MRKPRGRKGIKAVETRALCTFNNVWKERVPAAQHVGASAKHLFWLSWAARVLTMDSGWTEVFHIQGP